MKVILLEELKGRGGEGDVIDVANGFATNYLFPRKIAVAATPGNLKQLEQRKHNILKREESRVGDSTALFNKLNDKTVTVEAKVGEGGHLFGSVTTAMIEEAVSAQLGVEIDRKKIDTHGALKDAGVHAVTIAIYRDIKAELNVDIVAEGAAVVADAAAEESVEVAEEAPVEESVEVETVDSEA